MQPNEESSGTARRRFEDEGGLLPDSGGVVKNDVVVGDGTGVNTCGLRQHQQQQQHSQRHRYREEQSQLQPHYQQRQEEELEDFLCFRGPPEQEMVAQEMAHSYTQLLHPGQEPQEFISLEELQPRIHQEHHVHDNHSQVVSTMSPTGAQLYQHHHQQQQQRSYYNLSAVQESSCSTVYFGDIGTGSGVGEVTVASAGGG
ncbi:PREDICTED: sex-determining region Y protein-like, partial [Habropoda laboriosa]|uniref:sex-determining region Y protein-like n=1 Tax=Habropoda laboriosa TaxID=597456 RepID=UPI00083CFD1E